MSRQKSPTAQPLAIPLLATPLLCVHAWLIVIPAGAVVIQNAFSPAGTSTMALSHMPPDGQALPA